MDTLSSLAATQVAAVTTTLEAGSAGAAVASSTSASNSAATPSVLTIFSAFTQNFLLQQANSNSALTLNALAVDNPFSPSLSAYVGGRLYTSAGVLQQYATSLFMTNLEGSQSSDLAGSTDDSVFTNAIGLSDSTGDSNQTLLNILDAYSQIAMLGGLSAVGSRQSTQPLTVTTQPQIANSHTQASVNVFA